MEKDLEFLLKKTKKVRVELIKLMRHGFLDEFL